NVGAGSSLGADRGDPQPLEAFAPAGEDLRVADVEGRLTSDAAREVLDRGGDEAGDVLARVGDVVAGGDHLRVRAQRVIGVRWLLLPDVDRGAAEVGVQRSEQRLFVDAAPARGV